MSTRQVDSFLEWVTVRPAGAIRWLALVPIYIFAMIMGAVLAAPLQLVLPDTKLGNLVAVLAGFPGTLLLLAGLASLVLWRPAWMFVARWRRPEWDMFLKGAAIQFVCMAVAMLAFELTGIVEIDYQRPDVALLLATVPVALVGFLIQAGAEEFAFRGVFQQLAFRFTTIPIIVIGIQALGFASLHVNNIDELSGGWLGLAPFIATASLWGWFAWRTGAIWFGLGMHWANNSFLILAVGSHDDLLEAVSGLSFIYAHPTAGSVATADVSSTLFAGVVAWWLVLRHIPSRGNVARARRRGRPTDDVALTTSDQGDQVGQR
jgi:membrane protease YdiL (CAAX protease family)